MSRKKNETSQAEFEDDADALELDAAVDTDTESVELTEAEKLNLETEAKAEVLAALKASKAKAFKAQAKKRLQAEIMFRNGQDEKGQDMLTVDLLLASHPKFITLDGARYYSGRKYTVSRGKAQVLLDQMHRGWDQEEARLSPETKGHLQQHRNFRMIRKGDGYGLQQVS